MNALRTTATMTLALLMTGTTLASSASTSATAGRGRDGGAAATASYEGRDGFARTDTRTGVVNTSRGVAVGVDEDGISVSVSNAVATPYGPAIATNFNMTVGRNGSAVSTGSSTASGSRTRSATAGGSTSSSRYAAPVASSFASGHTGPGGHVQATTQSRTHIVKKVVHKKVVRRMPVTRRIVRR